MIRQGRVKELEGETAKIVLSDMGCEACGTPCANCRKPQKQIAKVRNTISADIGDLVELECPDRLILRTVVLLFLIPLLAGIFLCVIMQLFWKEANAVLYSFLAAALLFLMFAFFLSREKQRGRISFQLTRILEKTKNQKELDKP